MSNAKEVVGSLVLLGAVGAWLLGYGDHGSTTSATTAPVTATSAAAPNYSADASGGNDATACSDATDILAQFEAGTITAEDAIGDLDILNSVPGSPVDLAITAFVNDPSGPTGANLTVTCATI